MDPSSTPPKLSPYSLPSQRREPPATETPPPGIPVSIPFLWEEAPGKPRERPAPGAAPRILILPPRMVAAAAARAMAGIKSDKVPSPTTVLDGPEQISTQFGSRHSIPSGEVSDRNARGIWFRRKGGGRKVVLNSVGMEDKGVIYSSMSSSYWRNGGELNEVGNNVRITRLRTNRSLASFATSHIWGTIYGSLKQVPLPWRRDRKA